MKNNPLSKKQFIVVLVGVGSIAFLGAFFWFSNPWLLFGIPLLIPLFQFLKNMQDHKGPEVQIKGSPHPDRSWRDSG